MFMKVFKYLKKFGIPTFFSFNFFYTFWLDLKLLLF